MENTLKKLKFSCEKKNMKKMKHEKMINDVFSMTWATNIDYISPNIRNTANHNLK